MTDRISGTPRQCAGRGSLRLFNPVASSYADRQRPAEIAGNIVLVLSDDLRGVSDRQPVGLLGVASLDRGDDLLMLVQPDSHLKTGAA